MTLEVLPQGHDRAKFLGGSDMAAVIGMSPWKTPYDLWADKITPRSDNPHKPVFKRGIRWESVVAEMLVESLESQGHTVEFIGTNNRYRDPEFDFMAAEIDFEIKLDGSDEITNVELKTVHPFKLREWGDSGTDTAPVHYTTQVLHGLGVTGRKNGLLAALFGADELRTYPIPADAETIAWLRDQGAAFWRNHVLTGIAPEAICIDDTQKLHPAAGDEALSADPDVTEWLMRMREAKAEIKAREAELDSLEFRVRKAMGASPEIILPNGKTACEWKTRSGTYLDQEALKAAHPKIARQFTRKWEKRTFALKAFSAEGV